MPAIPRTVVALPIPEELKSVLTDGWQGTLQVEAEVDEVQGGHIQLAITGVYPDEVEQDYGPLLEEDTIEAAMPEEE